MFVSRRCAPPEPLAAAAHAVRIHNPTATPTPPLQRAVSSFHAAVAAAAFLFSRPPTNFSNNTDLFVILRRCFLSLPPSVRPGGLPAVLSSILVSSLPIPTVYCAVQDEDDNL